ncbi:PF03745 domain protein [Leptospira inadai serovar Lyme str. 10]|uniref:PF03745 domain protein n=2 Tax=Leptospira inadai serovar Lyme TaxID=293084 RepID=V6HCV4_9LEPT|nr:DUF309 domain-containing protein [Leptospira inadai]EQA37547.1 PF03745 domain protein [Leptospira inadai serovar Lyme str. 10]PNV72776.1 DUF309 domain-containing protein [Leptospira inadai serovar Lyme]
MEFDPEILAILDRIRNTPDLDSSFSFAWMEGRKLYFAGNYFELHEVFEFQWKKESGGRKLLLHGWIQLAISLNKIFKKPNIRGARMQAEKSKEKFDALLRSSELSSAGRTNTVQTIRFLETLLTKFSGDIGWDFEQIRELSLPTMTETGEEWFSSI